MTDTVHGRREASGVELRRAASSASAGHLAMKLAPHPLYQPLHMSIYFPFHRL